VLIVRRKTFLFLKKGKGGGCPFHLRFGEKEATKKGKQTIAVTTTFWTGGKGGLCRGKECAASGRGPDDRRGLCGLQTGRGGE